MNTRLVSLTLLKFFLEYDFKTSGGYRYWCDYAPW